MKFLSNLKENWKQEMKVIEQEKEKMFILAKQYDELSDAEKIDITKERWIVMKIRNELEQITSEEGEKVVCRICSTHIEDEIGCPECNAKLDWMADRMVTDQSMFNDYNKFTEKYNKEMDNIELHIQDSSRTSKEIIKDYGTNVVKGTVSPLMFTGKAIGLLAKGKKNQLKDHIVQPIINLKQSGNKSMGIYDVESILTPEEQMILKYAPPGKEFGDHILDQKRKQSKLFYWLLVPTIITFFAIMLLI